MALVDFEAALAWWDEYCKGRGATWAGLSVVLVWARARRVRADTTAARVNSIATGRRTPQALMPRNYRADRVVLGRCACGNGEPGNALVNWSETNCGIKAWYEGRSENHWTSTRDFRDRHCNATLYVGRLSTIMGYHR